MNHSTMDLSTKLSLSISLAVVASLAFAALPSSAGDRAINCAKASATVEMNVCADRAFQRADAALNSVYEQAIASLPSRAGDEYPYDKASWEYALRSSQRAWITFRDEECNAHVPMLWTGGSGTNAAVAGCKTRLTKARSAELRNAYDGR
jgi:uncharacterized protein YecT (DUF1311 family)